MAEPSKDTDQSMEDILQSIKRIIADEEQPAVAEASDVLELTELLAEDVSVEAPAAPALSIEEIMAMPMVDAVPLAPAPAAVVPPVAVAAPAPAAPMDSLMSDATVAASIAALHTLSHAPEPLVLGSAGFRSGTTVEDLVVEALKPMLKEWLDGNLPALVKSLVEKEIRRLSA